MSSLKKWLLSFMAGPCGFHCFLGVAGRLRRVKEIRLGEPQEECRGPVGGCSHTSVQRKELCLSIVPCLAVTQSGGWSHPAASALVSWNLLDVEPKFSSPG